MIRIIIKLANKYKRLIKFGISGGLATGTQFVILFILTDIFGLWYIVSASTGFVIAFMVSFNLQKYWTFQDENKGKVYRQMPLFFLAAFVGMLVNASGMYVLVDKFGLWYILAQVFMAAGIAVGNFFVYKFLIFSKSQSGPTVCEARGPLRRVLIATPIFPPVIGGPATYSKILCEEFPRRGYDVKVVTYGNVSDCRLSIINCRLICISRNQNVILKYWKFFRVVWRELAWADVVYVQDLVNAGLPVCLACFFGDKKFILKIVGDYAWEHGQECHGVSDSLDDFQAKKYGGKIGLIRRIQKSVAKEAVKIITPSNYLKGIIKGWGVEENKINVIYNAVKDAKVEETKEQVKANLSIGGDILITVGRLLPWKGFEALIDIMPVLNKANPNFKLFIVGEGPEEKNIRAKINNSPAKDNIEFIPGLEQKKLWQYMRASDLFILNTGYEGLPHIVIEAMMLGVPIITTLEGGNREIVENNQNVVVVEYNNREQIKNAIFNLWQDKKRQARLVEKARQDLKKFGRERMIEEVVEVFRDVGE